MSSLACGRGDGPVVSSETRRFCITPKMIEKDRLFDMKPGRGDRDMHCTQQILERSAHRLHVKMECTGEPGRGKKGAPALGMHVSGETIMEIRSRDSFSSSLTTDMTYGGRHSHSRAESEAHWLGADCGNVK